ncbi:hypothetical protein QTH89_26710 [Variovorax sp. J22G21]|uniref:hypothetical protein n=1 Tax=Variovorax fucosicus TaxID=3053517 RepID=UPI002574DBD1|nr:MULTISPECIES: hypothetical protein [unclassified Variovorax]MDM0042771.1 hypothetical protein [Variovorax sp. J22R193]MDM0064834.1 hypothetical protein [Variovorax sp. J22G21]
MKIEGCVALIMGAKRGLDAAFTRRLPANRPRLLRRFTPAGLVDAGIRKNLRLDAPKVPLLRIPALEK